VRFGVGDGVEAGALRETARMALTTWVRAASAPSRCRRLSAADALHLKDDPLFSVTIPSKLLTYLAIGKPIIACAAGEPAEILIDAQAGIACPPGDPAALASAASRIAALPESDRSDMGRAGRRYACAQFERREVISHIGKMLTDLVAGTV
jgi:glycosyltransferase involved in cell wall biosynthesis